MNKIEIKDLYLVFGPEKQKAFRMLKESPRLKKANQKAFSIKQKLSIILLSSVHFILSLSRKTE